MFWIAENVKTFLIDSMHTRKVELSSSGERLEVIHIRRRGIFQGCLFVHDFINFGIRKSIVACSCEKRLTSFL